MRVKLITVRMERKEGPLLILTVKSSPQQAILIDSENDKLSNLSRKESPLLGLKSTAISRFVLLSWCLSVHVPPSCSRFGLWFVLGCALQSQAISCASMSANSSYCPPA